MKNFSLEIYNSLVNGESTPEWEEMCKKCHEEYLLCKPKLSHRFCKWYENGLFHDAELLKISSTFEKDGAWIVNMSLWCCDGEVWVLRFYDVTDYRMVSQGKKEYEGAGVEECLDDEFYRFDENNADSSIVLEFFTLQDTMFYVKFEKLNIFKVSKKYKTKFLKNK